MVLPFEILFIIPVNIDPVLIDEYANTDRPTWSTTLSFDTPSVTSYNEMDISS